MFKHPVHKMGLVDSIVNHELLNCSGLLAWTRSGGFSTADWTKSGQDPKCCILIGCYPATLCPVSNPSNS